MVLRPSFHQSITKQFMSRWPSLMGYLGAAVLGVAVLGTAVGERVGGDVVGVAVGESVQSAKFPQVAYPFWNVVPQPS